MDENQSSQHRTKLDNEPAPVGQVIPGFVSVVIPAYNAEDTIVDQLEALCRQDYKGRWEVIIADNGSTDGTCQVLASFYDRFDGLRVVDASTRRGPAHARNVGAAAAKGDLLLFCDADDVVSQSWVRVMAQALRSADLVGGAGALTRSPEGNVFPGTPPGPTLFPYLPWVGGANLGVRRQQFEAAGGFDETRLTGEDVDLCWRIQLQGAPLRLVPDAFVSYRERDNLRESVARTYRFGREAHELYLAYGSCGAPTPGFRWALRGGFRLLARTPSLLRGSARRKRWMTSAGGIAGRLSAVFRYRFRLRTGCRKTP